MKVAIIGSRCFTDFDLSPYIPKETTEIVSGGARGVDTVARNYATSHGIKLTEFLPDYKRFGRGAPLVRNMTILKNADCVLAFWDGSSSGTRFVIDKCIQLKIPLEVFKPKPRNN